MKYISGKDRRQIEIFSLEQAIDQNNEVRLIDLFVGGLVLADFGFKTHFVDNGRPAYHPSDLLRLFIYGYLEPHTLFTTPGERVQAQPGSNVADAWTGSGSQHYCQF